MLRPLHRRANAHPSWPRYIVALLLLGAAIRVFWLIYQRGSGEPIEAGEATRVALSLARTGTFADAYFAGQGATAHLLPVSPALAAAIIWLTRPDSLPSHVALATWALVQTGAAYLLVRQLFSRLGAGAEVLRLGFAGLCLVPVFVAQEAIDFQFWEGALALSLVCVNLLWLVELHEQPNVRWAPLVGGSFLAAITFFVSPPAGLGVGACWTAFAFTRLTWRSILAFAALALAALTVVVGPWSLRNTHALGTSVLLRSNFGLELAIANHPAAASSSAPGMVFARRLYSVHPYHSESARTRVRSVGEVAYSSERGEEARRWIAAHPAAFARLALRHLRQFYFPDAWQMMFTGWYGALSARAWAVTLVNGLGLISLAAGAWRRRRGYGMLGLYVAVVTLPYVVVQPVPRYTYLVYPILLFAAVDMLVCAAGRRSAAGPGTAR